VTVLGIETATAVCGAAVSRDGAVLAEAQISAPQAHSERLLALVGEVLAAAGIAVGGLDGIACSIGPGSFTGLRIGLSVAKGLAYAADLPLAAVSTLEALAARAVGDGRAADGDTVLAAIDARRDEVYAASFLVSGGVLTLRSAPAAHTVSALAATFGAGARIVLAGDGGAKLRRAAPFLELPPAGGETCAPGPVALIGERMLRAGVRADLASVEPAYVKEFFTTAVPLSQ
jgi:tRNA threonylcarbamoyladenosine biosynthesis protein TsaB